MSRTIRYRNGYKYQLLEETRFFPPIFGYEAENQFLKLESSGCLTIRKGYAWDGPTGGLDTKSVMRASLVHDALYQLMHEARLPSDLKTEADNFFWEICTQDGVSAARAWWMRTAVRWGGSTLPAPDDNKEDFIAP